MNYLKIVLVLSFLACITFTHAQTHIHEINSKLGRGINYGNMLEAPSETAWGNPWKPEYPEIIAGLGFNHVRIPIQWESASRSSETAPYTIEPSFLNRVKEIVDATLDHKLMAIINMHHHDLLFEDPEGQKDRFLSQWQQIAFFFKDYSDSLVFEILNEPHDNMTPEKWNSFLQEALDVIRVENPTRAVMIGTANYGGLGGLPSLELPDDENIIVTIHYYNPFEFTHQGATWAGEQANEWLGTKWFDSDLERAVVESDFEQLRILSEENDVPVHIGEFGSFNMADLESRERWTTYLSRYFEQQGWSWAYWEFSAGFGIYDPVNETYVDELVDALVNNAMPAPATYEHIPIYQSDFATSLDGWFLNVNTSEGASAALTRENSKLKVTINQLGTQNWHIQLMHNNFSLVEGKKYNITFTGNAITTRPAVFYMGMSVDPWTQYGVKGVTVETTEKSYSYVFDMKVTDPLTRMVFDLGESLADFILSGVVIEELVLTMPKDPVVGLEDDMDMLVYPNPIVDHFFVNNANGFSDLVLFNTYGQLLAHQKLNNGLNVIDTRNYTNGIYFLRLSNQKRQVMHKVIIRQ